MNTQAMHRKNSHLATSPDTKKKQEDAKYDNKEEYYKFAKEEEWEVVSKTSEVMLDGMDDPFY